MQIRLGHSLPVLKANLLTSSLYLSKQPHKDTFKLSFKGEQKSVKYNNISDILNSPPYILLNKNLKGASEEQRAELSLDFTKSIYPDLSYNLKEAVAKELVEPCLKSKDPKIISKAFDFLLNIENIHNPGSLLDPMLIGLGNSTFDIDLFRDNQSKFYEYVLKNYSKFNEKQKIKFEKRELELISPKTSLAAVNVLFHLCKIDQQEKLFNFIPFIPKISQLIEQSYFDADSKKLLLLASSMLINSHIDNIISNNKVNKQASDIVFPALKSGYLPCLVSFRKLFSLTTSDKELKELTSISEKLQNVNEITMNDRKQVFEIEERILKQEAYEPAKYMDRAIMTGVHISSFFDDNDANSQLRLAALKGLFSQHISLKYSGIPVKNVDDYYNLIEKAVTDHCNYPELKLQITLYSLMLLEQVYKSFDNKTKNKALFLCRKLIERNEDPRSQSAISGFFGRLENTNNSQFFIDIKKHVYRRLSDKHSSVEQKRQDLLTLIKMHSSEKSNYTRNNKKFNMTFIPQMDKILVNILNDPKAPPELKQTAAWGAGIVQTKETFETLVDLLKAGKSDLKMGNNLKIAGFKEIVLNSIAEYVYKMPKTVTTILEKVKVNDKELKPVAEGLLHRINNDFNKPNFFIDQKLSSQEEAESYLELRSKYVKNIENLRAVARNFIDLALLPYRGMLQELINSKNEMIISKNTFITDEKRDLIGMRCPDGRFEDSVKGIAFSDSKNTIISKTNAFGYVAAHEFNHILFFMMDQEDKDKVHKLYKQALAHNKYLSIYASSNPLEYFAVGYESYAAKSLDHDSIIDRGNKFSGVLTRLNLKVTDPDLYNFIEYTIGKYGNPDFTKGLAVKQKNVV